MDDIYKQLSEGIPLEEILEKIKLVQMKDIENLELINMAKKWEKEGKTDHAAVVYEYLILNDFEGSFPYDRLIIIYKKQKNQDEMIRVLERAVYIFENVVFKDRADRLKKLEKYKHNLKELKKNNE